MNPKTFWLASITLSIIIAYITYQLSWVYWTQNNLYQWLTNVQYDTYAYTAASIALAVTFTTSGLYYRHTTKQQTTEKTEPFEQQKQTENPIEQETQQPTKTSKGGKKTKPKLLIAAFVCMFAAVMIMAYVTVQAQTQTQYNTKPWFVTVEERESTLKGHLIQTTVNFDTWQYTTAQVLVKNEGSAPQACSINILLKNANNATIAYGTLEDTGQIQPDLTAEYTIDLTWTNGNITDSRTWLIGTTPHTTP